jgi:hypothetical protein
MPAIKKFNYYQYVYRRSMSLTMAVGNRARWLNAEGEYG